MLLLMMGSVARSVCVGAPAGLYRIPIFDRNKTREGSHFGSRRLETGLRWTGELAAIEIVIPEQTPQVVHDFVASALDRAEGVDPIGVSRVHLLQGLRVAVLERRQQRQQRAADCFLIRSRELRKIGHVHPLHEIEGLDRRGTAFM
jgi:hypothetical protein